jgi:hypothetical protein
MASIFRWSFISNGLKPLSFFKPTLYTSKNGGASNIKSIIYYTSSNSSSIEQEFIARRIETIEKHQRFWAENNMKFAKEQTEFLEKSRFL